MPFAARDGSSTEFLGGATSCVASWHSVASRRITLCCTNICYIFCYLDLYFSHLLNNCENVELCYIVYQCIALRSVALRRVTASRRVASCNIVLH